MGGYGKRRIRRKRRIGQGGFFGAKGEHDDEEKEGEGKEE